MKLREKRSEFALYWRTRLTLHLGVLIAISVLYAGRSHAQDSEPTVLCLINIDGVAYESNPCDMSYNDGDVVMFGHLDEVRGDGYWVYLISNKDGSFRGYWNGESGNARAHNSLGVLKHIAVNSGDCYFNDQVTLYRGLQRPDESGNLRVKEAPQCN